MDKFIQQVKTYYEKYGGTATIAVRAGNNIIVGGLQEGIQNFDLKEKLQGEQKLIQKVFKKRKGTNAIIISSLNYTTVVAQSGRTIPPLLDDLAQIVGPSVRCSKTQNATEVLSKLIGRNACMIKNKGAFATGRTLDEANTTTRVLEKGAKAFIESSMIGGVKPISKIEAVLMHFIYKKKYSKLDQNMKIKEMQ